MDKDFFNRSGHLKLLSILMGIAYLILMFGNGQVSFTHPDEVFYSQSAKEMLRHNSWFTPMIFDEPQFEKPIFFFWLLMIAFKLFGLTPEVGRFWPACFGMIGVGVTYGIAWMMFRNKKTAFVSGVILCTSLIYMALSRAILTDMVFSVWVLIAIAFFYLAYTHPKYKDFGIIMYFVVMAIAVLTKGVLGICFPLGCTVGFLIYKKDLGFLKCKAALCGVLWFILLAVPWHVLMYKWYGQWFIDEYWQNVHVRRLFDAEHRRNNFFMFYFLVMFGGTMPWCFFLIPTVGMIYREIRKKGAYRDQFVFLLLWIGSVWIFIQPAASKLASYVFPVYPALSVMLGHYLVSRMEMMAQGIPSKGIQICGRLLPLLLGVGAVVGIINAEKYILVVLRMEPIYLYAVLFLIFALVIAYFVDKKQYGKMFVANASVTGLVLMILFLSRPIAEPWVSCKEISELFQTIDNSKRKVLTSKFYVRGVRFYTDRDVAVIDVAGSGFFSPHPIAFLNTEEKVVGFLEHQPVTYAIVKWGDVKRLYGVLSRKGNFKIKYLHDFGGKYILKIDEKD